ncbi:MAG: hypothetical protein ACOYO1_08845 [Bacteroidales bacterium]
MQYKEAQSFKDAIADALKELLDSKQEMIRLEFPFSGMYVQLNPSEEYPSDVRNISDYIKTETVINDDYFFLVIENLMGRK